jgi:hypothetical protein
MYTGDPIMCGNDVVVNTNTIMSQALNDLASYFCAKI